MSIWEAIIYGIIQGIAEFLPISSSGHLSLVQNFAREIFNKDVPNAADDQLGFNIALHLATLISVCVVYREDVFKLLKGFWSLVKKIFNGKFKLKRIDKDEKLFLMIALATLPLIPVKLMGLDDAVDVLCKTSWAIGAFLIFNGLMLIYCDRIRKGDANIAKGGFWRPLGVGMVQALIGIMPGISRSGSTITGGRILGYSREEAVRLSFLMSIPAILGACVTELPDMFGEIASEGFALSTIAPILVGSVVAAVVGFFAIKLLQYLTKNKSFAFFSVYCIVVGVIAIVGDIIV